MSPQKAKTPVREHQGDKREKSCNQNSNKAIISRIRQIFYPYTWSLLSAIAEADIRGEARTVLDYFLMKDVFGKGAELDVDKIVRECGCSQSTCYAAVKKLEEEGFIEIYGTRYKRKFRNLWGVNLIREDVDIVEPDSEDSDSDSDDQDPGNSENLETNSEILESNSENSEPFIYTKNQFTEKLNNKYSPHTPQGATGEAQETGKEAGSRPKRNRHALTRPLTKGPWWSADRPEEVNREEYRSFYKWLLSGAELSTQIKNPPAFVTHKVKELRENPEIADLDTYWKAFVNGEGFPGNKPVDAEWCDPDGKPWEKFWQYVYEPFLGEFKDTRKAALEAQKALDKPHLAARLWEDFKRRIITTKEDAQKLMNLGANPYIPTWMGEVANPTVEEAAEAIGFLHNAQQQLAPAPESNPTPEIKPEEEISPEQKEALQEAISGKRQWQETIAHIKQKASGLFHAKARPTVSPEQTWEAEFNLKFNQSLKMLFGGDDLYRHMARKWFEEHFIPCPPVPTVDEDFHEDYRHGWLNLPMSNSFTDRLRHQAAVWFASRSDDGMRLSGIC